MQKTFGVCESVCAFFQSNDSFLFCFPFRTVMCEAAARPLPKFLGVPFSAVLQSLDKDRKRRMDWRRESIAKLARPEVGAVYATHVRCLHGLHCLGALVLSYRTPTCPWRSLPLGMVSACLASCV